MSRPSTFDLELFNVDFRDQRIESTLKTPGELNISKKVDFLVTLLYTPFYGMRCQRYVIFLSATKEGDLDSRSRAE